MTRIHQSSRVKNIEQKWGKSIHDLFYQWHWEENLKHREIAQRVDLPRPTITRWFHKLNIQTQSGTRFTNLNLLNVGSRKTPPAKSKKKKEFPWKFDKDFFKKWTREMAYVLGLLFTDGYVYKNPRGSWYFGLTSTDKEIIEKIRSLLNSNHKIGHKKRHETCSNWQDVYVLQIGSKETVGDLRGFGIVQNKSLRIAFPNVPNKFLGDFVRGCFDGDGGVYFGKGWRKDRNKNQYIFHTTFTSGSERFLQGLWRVLKNHVYGGGLYKKKNGHGLESGYSLVFSRRDSVALFKVMYNNISSNMFLERKYRKFLEAFKKLNYQVAGVV